MVARRVHHRASPVPTAVVARLALAALLLMACAITAPQPAAAGRTWFRVSPAARAKATAKAKKRATATLATARALARGTAIEGPRHTGRAIRKNPRTFAAGTLLIGTAGAVAHKLGLNGEHVALTLSSIAVAAQVRAAWPTLKQARGVELARRIGADILWPAVLFGLSYGVGHSIGGHGPPADAQGASDLATAFAASAVIGGDAPAVGVTALDTSRGGSGR